MAVAAISSSFNRVERLSSIGHATEISRIPLKFETRFESFDRRSKSMKWQRVIGWHLYECLASLQTIEDRRFTVAIRSTHCKAA